MTTTERAAYVRAHWLRAFRAVPVEIVEIRQFLCSLAVSAQKGLITQRQYGTFLRYLPLACMVCGKDGLYRVGNRGYCQSHKEAAVKDKARSNVAYDQPTHTQTTMRIGGYWRPRLRKGRDH